MTNRIPSKCTDCPYRGRHIYLVGSERFDRELMASFIGMHTAAKSFEVDLLEEISVSNEGVPHGQKMILIDAHNSQKDGLLRLLQSTIWKTHSHNLMAFFNLQRQYGLEKEALKHSARGFLYDDDSTEDLINGICAINSGELWISRRIMSECLLESYIGRDLPDPVISPLSGREVEILHSLSTGATNGVIADQMCISPHTVKTHLQHIFSKLDVDNRLQAVLWAKENL